MPARRARVALATITAALVTLPGVAAGAAVRTGAGADAAMRSGAGASGGGFATGTPVLAGRAAAPGCANAPAPVEPVTALPWAQQRYAPDRLTPLATGSGVTVGVIDSGVDSDHVQLRDRVLRGNDFLDRGLDGSRDCAGHGTAVASLIAANPRDGVEFRGLAPKAKILPVRVSEQQIIDGRESGRTVAPTDFARAIRWAVDNGADVLNLSVVLYQDSEPVRKAIEHARDKDVVVVAAAGNLHENGDPRPYPAAYEGVIGVGAIAANGQRAPFSQVGSYVDVVAPGDAVLVAAPGRGHVEQSGTSYAAPFVAATAALLRDYWPDLTAAEVAARIVATADPAPDSGGGYGSGVLNPYRALTETGALPRISPEAALPRTDVDPALVAKQARRDAARDRALLVAAAAAGVAVLTVLIAVVVPRGIRRRWRAADPA